MRTINNYDIMRQAAMTRFCGYDPESYRHKPGVRVTEKTVFTHFLGMDTQISRENGQVTLLSQPADFSETLAVLDWLCDGLPEAAAAGTYCPVSSLPGVFVRGNGLYMDWAELAMEIQAQPERFRQGIVSMGGRVLPLGDLGGEIPVFPGLFMRIKSYRGDGEFPPSVTLLWDENILSFIRYETVYYLADALKKRLKICLREGANLQ